MVPIHGARAGHGQAVAVPAGDARDGQAAEGPDGARHEGVLRVAMAQPPEVTPAMQLAWIVWDLQGRSGIRLGLSGPCCDFLECHWDFLGCCWDNKKHRRDFYTIFS